MPSCFSSLLSGSSSFRDFLNPLIPLPSEDPRSPSLLGPKIMSRIASIRINSHMPKCPNIAREGYPNADASQIFSDDVLNSWVLCVDKCKREVDILHFECIISTERAGNEYTVYKKIA